MRALLQCCGLLLAGLLSAGSAQAQTWMTVYKDLQIETESMAIDGDGYVLFKTRNLNADGTIRWQHKEAVHCGRGTHAYRKMYDADDEVYSPSNEDAWPNWRDNPSETRGSEAFAAEKDFVCSRNVGEVGVPICDELVRKMRACWQAVPDAGVRSELQRLATEQAGTLRAMSSGFAETVCRADLDVHRKERDYGCEW